MSTTTTKGSDGKSEKITVTLTPNAARYFALVRYGLTKQDGATPANQSECISHILEAAEKFEDATDYDLLAWVNDFELMNEPAKAFLSYPTQDNYQKMVDAALAERSVANPPNSTNADHSINSGTPL